MASFDIAQRKVKVFEGGYSDTPNDDGNWTGGKIGVGKLIGTNHGISAPKLSEYLGREATKDDMTSLSYSTAVKIYKSQFWNKIKGDKIKTQSVAEIIYDGAVNQGVGAMTTIISKITRENGITDYAIKKINTGNQKNIFNQIKEERKKRYDAKKSSYAYGSWISRLNAIDFVRKYPVQITLGFLTLGLFAATAVYYVANKNKIQLKMAA